MIRARISRKNKVNKNINNFVSKPMAKSYDKKKKMLLVNSFLNEDKKMCETVGPQLARHCKT